MAEEVYNSSYTGAQIDEGIRKSGKAVLTEAQTLTEEQKQQARANIGAAGKAVSSMTYNASSNKWVITYTDNTTSSVDGPAIPDVSAYMPKSGGTFTGAAYAGSAAQTPGSYLVRNIKLSATAETPTVNGEICFRYE